MPKVFISIGAAFAALVALLLIAPSFMDWTAYRQTFASAMSVATGRRVEIGGDMTFALLPRPAFNAADVRIGADGNSRAVTVERLSAHLAFAPLLGGRLQFNSLVLTRPTAEIGRRADGSFDLPLAPVESDANTESAAMFDVQVDRIEIAQGAAVIIAANGDVALRADGIDLVYAADAEEGPFTLNGGLNASGVPMSLNMAFGRGFPDGSRAFTATMTLDEADATARFNGTMFLTEDNVGLRGALNASGPSVAGVLAAFGLIDPATPVPLAATQPFMIDAALRGDEAGAELTALVLDAGGTRAKGALTWQSPQGDTVPRLSVKLELARVDLSTWRLAALNGAPRFAGLVSAAQAQGARQFFLPRNMNADIDLRAPALTYHDQTVRDAVITGTLENGELTLSEASASLPSATKAKAYGFVRAVEGAPSFDGAVEFDSQSLRQFLTWLDYDANLPEGRFGQLVFRAALQGTPQRFTLSDMNGAVDTSRFKGRLSMTRGARVGVNADVEIDSLNIDSYSEMWESAPAAPTPQGDAAQGYGVAPGFTSLAWLSGFDADVRVQVASLMGSNFAGGRLGADVALNAGTLNLRTVALENVAGASAWLSGSISGFGTAPRFDNVQFDVRSEDLSRLARLLHVPAPASLRGLTPAALTGTVNGGLMQADVSGAVQAGGLAVKVKGQGLNLDQMPRLTFDLDGNHANFAELAQMLGLPQPAANVGAVVMTGRITSDLKTTRLENVTLTVGKNTLAVTGGIDRSQSPPMVTGEVTNIAVDIDTLWPRDPLERFTGGGGGSGTGSRWSDAPLDWSALTQWSGDVRLSGSRLNARGLSLQDFNTRLTLADGTLDMAEWSGNIFGGAAQVTFQASAAPQPSVEAQVTVTGGDLSAFAAALSSTAKPMGTLDLGAAFNAEGVSERAMIGSLAGRGSLAVKASSLGDHPLPGLLAPLTAAQQAETLAQGESREAAMTARAQLAADAGRIQLEQAIVESLSYTGTFKGYIDLPLWQVDLAGSLKAQGGASVGFGQGQMLLPPELPVRVQGPLDLPNVTLMATDALP